MFEETKLSVEGSSVFKLTKHESESGTTMEIFDILKSFPSSNLPQITVSRSGKNVIRGLHCSPYQKLVCCPTGRAFDVVVDVRPNSPTFMKWSGCWLDSNTHIIIPAYCAHGFFSAEDDTSILYLQGGCFTPDLDFSFKYDDPKIGIDWPKPIDADDYIISPKDMNNPLSSSEITQKILERIENPLEAMNFSVVDFAIVGDIKKAPKLINAINEAGMKAHLCFGSGTRRETLEKEIASLRPKCALLYIISPVQELSENFVEIMNVAGACHTYNRKLIIIHDGSDFVGKAVITKTLLENYPEIKFLDENSCSTLVHSLK